MEVSNTEVVDTKSELPLTLLEARDLLNAIYIINAIWKTFGNVSLAAEELGIGRRTIYELMEKYGISCDKEKFQIEFAPFLSYMELHAPCLENYISHD